MRFLKPINHLQVASKTYDNKLMDPFLQLTTIIRNLAYAGYLTIDGVIFFKLLGIINAKNSQIYLNMLQDFGWLV